MSDEATFQAETPQLVGDGEAVYHDAETDEKDVTKLVQDVAIHADPLPTGEDVVTAVADGGHTIEDVHKVVTDIYNEIHSLKEVVAEVKPHLETVLNEVRDKGIVGLMSSLMSAFRG